MKRARADIMEMMAIARSYPTRQRFRGLALNMWLIVDLIPPSFDGFRAIGVCSLLK